MIKKYKKEINIFLGAFLLMFIIGIIFSYFLHPDNGWPSIFDFDISRVFVDLSIRNYDHYRIKVHPLFVIFFQPIIYILKKIIGNEIISIILVQSIISALIVLLVYKSLEKISKNRKLNILLVAIFSLSWTQIIFSSMFETFIYAQIFLLVLWFYAFNRLDKKLTIYDYIFLVILGITSMGVTITNVVQFIIVLGVLILANKEENNKWIKFLIIILTVFAYTILFAVFQNILWPSAPIYFNQFLSEFINHNSEEFVYITPNINFSSLLNVLNANFAYAYNIFTLIVRENGEINFNINIISNLFSIICWLIFVIFNLIFIKKIWSFKDKHKIYFSMLIAYLFNFCLHLFYGNDTAFLYNCHYNYLIIFIIAYIINYLRPNLIISKKFLLIFIILFSLFSFKSIFELIKLLNIKYDFIYDVNKVPFIIILAIAVLILLCFINIKKKKVLFLSILISFALAFSLNNFFNKHNNKVYEKCTDLTNYDCLKDKMYLYKRELNELKKELAIKPYTETQDNLGIYYFGLVNRRKMVYQKGKLFDLKTQEIIKEFDYIEEYIIPNEKTVLLKDNNSNIYRIYENNDGIFIANNDEIEIIDDTKLNINYPSFEEYKYSEILKVLLQEVLFNIDDNVPKPNIFGYNEAWYRDTVLATMVLERTNNVDILIPWVMSIDSIYDYARAKDLKEADSLGALLYILGATKVDRKDLVEKIVEEIDNIRKPDGSIRGPVDGWEQAYYPTALALHGAKKLGIDLNLTLPSYDDGYARLTWYTDKRVESDIKIANDLYESAFPYLNWAYYHYNPTENLYMLDEIYPLSYELVGFKPENECFISEFYCSRNIVLSHIWHASEMFLYLTD